MLPVPGSGGYEWKGFLAPDQLPHSYNPPKGFIATANNKMIPEGYRYKIGYEWYPPYRVNRITQVIEEAAASGRKLAAPDFEQLQGDQVSLPGRELAALLRTAAGDHPSGTEQMLLNWNGVLEQNSAAAALYELYLGELKTAIIRRAAPQSLWAALEGWDWEPDQVLSYLLRPGAVIFGTDAEKERDQVLRDSLRKAAERLSQLEGDNPDKWSWGKLHYAKFRHSLDRDSGAASLTDLGPVPRSGDASTVGATGWYGDSFEQFEGASYREILDPGNWDRSVAINTPGQSGQPASSHYSDLLPLWSEWRYFPLAYSRDAVEKNTTDKLILEPGSNNR
jgi:penicillin G amidase